MAENRKAIIISTGMDNIQLLATLKETEGMTAASLDRVKGLYAKLSEQQATLEARKNAESLARLKANDDAKLAEIERFFAAQRAMHEENAAVAAVGNGSVPVGWAGGAGKAAKGAEEVEKDVKKTSSGLREAGHALRELGIIVADITGISIAAMVLKRVGTALRAIAMIGGGAVAVLTAGAVGIAGNIYMRKQLNEMGTESKDSVKTRSKQHEEMEKYITGLSKRGLIKPEQEKDLQYRLRGGDTESLIYVQGRLRQILPDGFDLKTASGNAQTDDTHRNAARQAMNPDQRWDDTTMQLLATKAEMNKLNPHSPEFRDKQKEYNKLLHQQNQDSAGIAKWTSDLKKAEGEKAKLEADKAQQNRVYPTLAELSKSKSLEGEMAQRVQFLQKDQKQRRAAGDILGANYDATQATNIMGKLQGMGALAPNRHNDDVQSHLKSLKDEIKGLRTGVQKVSIAGVEGD